MSVSLAIRREGAETYTAVAHREGRFYALSKTFQFSDSAEEIEERVKVLKRTDPGFASRWHGYTVYPVVLSRGVPV